MIKYILLWFPMLLIAVGNGSLRDFVYKRWTGALAAHQISTLSLLLFFALYIYWVVARYPPVSGRQALMVGLLWTLMTLCFEFGLGRWRGRSWSELFQDYKLWEGRIWL